MLPASRRTLVFMLLLGLAGCANHAHRPPVEERTDVPSRRIVRHVVSPGETLFSIAWSYGIDYRTLAATNNIGPPYTVASGQRLRLPDSVNGAKDASAITSKVNPAARSTPTVKAGKSASGSASQSPAKPLDAAAVLKTQALPSGWRWPARGAVAGRDGLHSPALKGIDIRGELGEPVYAANSGKVVYAGSGLVGYGNLLIIKHNDRYLSAYAHNNRLLVAEGAVVKAGDQVAEIGDSGTDSMKLYFEIRCDGEPVDPLRILPAR